MGYVNNWVICRDFLRNKELENAKMNRSASKDKRTHGTFALFVYSHHNPHPTPSSSRPPIRAEYLVCLKLALAPPVAFTDPCPPHCPLPILWEYTIPPLWTATNRIKIRRPDSNIPGTPSELMHLLRTRDTASTDHGPFGRWCSEKGAGLVETEEASRDLCGDVIGYGWRAHGEEEDRRWLRQRS